LTRSQFEKTFDFLAEYFQSERIRLWAQPAKTQNN
jgi:hypothetical protein